MLPACANFGAWQIHFNISHSSKSRSEDDNETIDATGDSGGVEADPDIVLDDEHENQYFLEIP